MMCHGREMRNAGSKIANGPPPRLRRVIAAVFYFVAVAAGRFLELLFRRLTMGAATGHSNGIMI